MFYYIIKIRFLEFEKKCGFVFVYKMVNCLKFLSIKVNLKFGLFFYIFLSFNLGVFLCGLFFLK